LIGTNGLRRRWNALSLKWIRPCSPLTTPSKLEDSGRRQRPQGLPFVIEARNCPQLIAGFSLLVVFALISCAALAALIVWAECCESCFDTVACPWLLAVDCWLFVRPCPPMMSCCFLLQARRSSMLDRRCWIIHHHLPGLRLMPMLLCCRRHRGHHGHRSEYAQPTATIPASLGPNLASWMKAECAGAIRENGTARADGRG